MKSRKHIPVRTCRGCGRRSAKADLNRLVAADNGKIIEDLTGSVPGRGVYCCKNEQCRQRLLGNKKNLRRFFRIQVG